MEVQGKIIEIGTTQEVGANGFTKRTLVIETQEQYPVQIPMDFLKDKTSILDGYSIGEEVKVGINLRGSKSGDRWFLNCNGWRIEKTNGTTQAPATTTPPATENPFSDDGDDSGLPF